MTNPLILNATVPMAKVQLKFPLHSCEWWANRTDRYAITSRELDKLIKEHVHGKYWRTVYVTEQLTRNPGDTGDHAQSFAVIEVDFARSPDMFGLLHDINHKLTEVSLANGLRRDVDDNTHGTYVECDNDPQEKSND